ncbi:hypothetical protein EON80_08570, partial [bacterium]
AKAGEDYGAKSSTGTIAAGQLSTTIAVVVNGDTLPETDEFFNLNLTEIKGAILKRSSAVGTITNDDATPTLSVSSVAVPEGNSGTTDATFQVTLSTASSQSVTVQFATVNGTAVAGDDFTVRTGTLTFAPGETTKAIVVKIKGDMLDEDDEQFGLKLTDPTNATLLVGQGSAKITDNDAAPTVSINSVSGIETAKNLVFTVALSAPSAKPVKVAYTTANGTAKAKLDYLATTGELTFAPGTDVKTILVPLKNDVQDEDTETFALNLTKATNASFSQSKGTGTITDDDGVPAITISDVTVTEINSGGVSATFGVRLSVASSKTVVVDFATLAGTATPALDFSAINGKIVFAPGQVSKGLTVNVRGDQLDELEEQFQVKLTSPVNATIADGLATCTIRDNDSAPKIAMNRPSITEGDAGTSTFDFTLSLSGPSGRPITVDYKTAVPATDGATPGVDYILPNAGKLTFAPGETSKTVTVTVIGDSLDEGNERINLVLSAPTNTSFANGKAATFATIVDNDATPMLSIDDVTVAEGNAAASVAKFTITLSAPSGRAVSVDFVTTKGSASSPSDFTGLTGSYTFAPGETTKTVSVAIKGDTVVEGDEQFKVTLVKNVNAGLSKAVGVGTITNDDLSPVLAAPGEGTVPSAPSA